MRFDRLTLEQFKCFDTASVTFPPGVTVIHGVNGSGKSSLLDACFFALYGSDTLDGTTLDEIISTGESEATLSLEFMHDGTSMELIRELRIRGERASTTRCELIGNDETITGARSVKAAIADRLRMDADAFLNCAYVRQGEVNKLIHASPAERQDMIDDLLQLGVLEDYRDRATLARRGVATTRNELRGQLDGISEQISAKESKELHAALNEAENEQLKYEAEIERIDENITEATETRDQAQEFLDTHAERREKLERVGEEIESIRNAIEETVDERSAVTDQLASIANEREACQKKLERVPDAVSIDPRDQAALETAINETDTADEELRESIESTTHELQEYHRTVEDGREWIADLRERADELEAKAASLEATVEEEIEAIETKENDLEALRERLEELTGRFAEVAVTPDTVNKRLDSLEKKQRTLQEQESTLRARIDGLTTDIEEAETLIEAGKCPTCGQEVVHAPAVDAIEEDRVRRDELTELLNELTVTQDTTKAAYDRLDELAAAARERERVIERIDHAETLLAEQRRAIEERRENIDTNRTKATKLREESKDRLQTVDEATTKIAQRRERVAALNEERQELKSKREQLAELLSVHETLADLENRRERLEERRDSLDTLLAERRDRLTEKREQRAELQEHVDDDRVETARSELDRATAYLEQAQSTRTEFVEKRDAALDQIGGIRNELDELEQLRDRSEALRKRVEAIDTLHEDVTTLGELYSDLRADLRERNVQVLERLLNETFALVYRNDAYDRITLDREYRFTVLQKDGKPLSPDQLSGGERALFNLSLRCAIYRLLAETVQGTGPLPPLILDEPTVFLDDGHVTKLLDLVDAMRDLGVEQMLLVTHDPELLRAADTTLTVEKDPTSNRSTVRSEASLSAQLSAE